MSVEKVCFFWSFKDVKSKQIQDEKYFKFAIVYGFWLEHPGTFLPVSSCLFMQPRQNVLNLTHAGSPGGRRPSGTQHSMSSHVRFAVPEDRVALRCK